MLDFLKALGGPGSWSFLGWCGAIALFLALVWPRQSRPVLVWVSVVGVSYLLMSLPLVANRLADGLSPVAVTDFGSLGPLETLVVFDGDNRRGRLRAALAIDNALDPAEVWVLGDAWLLDALLQEGVRRGKIKHEDAVTTTGEQIAQLAELVRRRPGRMAVVVSRLQLPRVRRATANAGIGVTLVPSLIDDEPPSSGWARLRPSYIALRVSRDALYEYAALAWHSWRAGRSGS